MKGTTATLPYVNLPMGEEFLLFPEDNRFTIPVDLSKESLRGYSPFVLSVNPPPLEYGLLTEADKPFSSPLSNTRLKSRAVANIRPVISSTSRKPVSSNSRVGLKETVEAGFSDRDQLIDVARQMDHLTQLPPIVFLINPSSMSRSYENIQAYQEMSRYGFIFQRWGEQLPKLSITCNVGAFICGREDGTKGLSGLQFASKRDSAGWRNLMNIFSVYRNSASVVDRLARTRGNHAVGTQSIHYDGQEWVGRIDNFSYGIDENKQNGGFEFSFEFTVFKHFYRDFDFKSEILPMTQPTNVVR